MRNKKLLLASAALILTLGLAACNTGGKTNPSKEDTTSEQESGSSSQVDPVRLITVTPPDVVVVGQQFDLDDYVVVDGGEGPKVFDVTVPAASAELVQVEGHKVTALAEGEFSLQITAGTERAAFRSVAMSALKAAFAEATAELGNTWGLYRLYNSQLYLGAVHRPDYTCFPGWGDNNEAGGFLKAQNGNTYSYILDDNMEVVTADPEIMSKFENYYCNYEWALSVSDFNTVEVEDEEGNVSYKLEMSGDIPGSWGSSYFPNKIAEFAYTLAQNLNASYKFSKLTVLPYTLGEGEEAVETFEFDLDIVAVADPETVVKTYSYVLEPDNEALEMEAVRTYIDEGNFPEALAFDELTTTIDAAAEAQVYKTQVQYGFIDDENYEFVSFSEAGMHYSWESVLGNATEVGYTSANYVYYDVTQTLEYDSTGTKLETPTTTNTKSGLIEKDGKLYSFNNSNDPAVLAATDTGVTSLWTDAIDYTIAPLSSTGTVGKDLSVTARTETDDGVQFKTSDENVMLAVINLAANGNYIHRNFANNFGSDYMKYCELEAFVPTDKKSIDFLWYMRFNGGYYFAIEIVLSEFGTTQDLSEVLDTIVYPA